VSAASSGARLELRALAGIPLVEPGADLPLLIGDALASAEGPRALVDGDVVVVASKLLSRAEGRFVDLAAVEPSPRAREVAALTGHDPRLAELILAESQGISRAVRGVLVVRHRLGFVCANAGIDASNALPTSAPAGTGPWVLLLPEAPDASADRLRERLSARFGARIGVVITDSHGRPFRLGTVGAAIGLSGLPALADFRGQPVLCGRRLELTITALADQVAAAADLVAGQAAEGRGVVLVRGLAFHVVASRASELCRPPEQDIYA
jgi:coenzyme F420-0:L-glutamate ligase/coenzyme F420-1:gamma-L-glutamate ligase